jgi:hypothetical protein
MNTNKHGSKRKTRQTALMISSAVLRESKLTKVKKTKLEYAWKIEIRKRIADFDAGKIREFPAEEVLKRAEAAIK